MVQKRRGMFRMWNIVLISLAFNLAALGMFFNRAGPVPSVHSFGESTIGWAFLSFFAASIIFSLALFLKRLPQLKNSRNLESMLSREAAFLINNFLLLAIAFIILWGIMFPIISQFLQGVTITVGAPFYNQTTGPLMLFIIFVMGIGPLLPWRQADISRITRALLIPLSTSVITILFLLIIGVRSPYPIIAFALCMFVATGILREWIIGTLKQRSKGGNYVIAFVRLIGSNRPRYGGYISHISILLLALGVTGSSFYSNQLDIILQPGETAKISEYTVKYVNSNFEPKGDRIERTVTLEASRNEQVLGYLTAQNHFYPSFSISSTRSAIRSTPIDDLYIIPQEFFEDNSVAFRIMVNPLVWWIWLAGPILLVGTLIAVWPSRRRNIDDAPFITPKSAQHVSSITHITPS
jgi:cytochrome c-type biogenesis protein CcmF